MGETSKTSGEIGEKLSKKILGLIGWEGFINNLSINCTNSSHLNPEKKPKTTHGEDQVYLYNNPFHDDRTDIIHVSNKNTVVPWKS